MEDVITQKYNIAVIPGDGIGKDVTSATLSIIEATEKLIGGFHIEYKELAAGAAYYKETGHDMSPEAESAVVTGDAILLGAIGLPNIRYDDGTEISPHLRLREQFQLYAGVRPVRQYSNVPRKLRDDRAQNIDFIVLRESTEGLFYSAATNNRGSTASDDEVRDTLRITRKTTEKLHDFAFKLARQRIEKGKRGSVTCVDKANVFRSMAFFRKIFDERAELYPDIDKSYSYVDAMALDLIRRPWEFDILVTENMFGDILSDLAGGLVGGMGIASCAEIGDEHGLFQPAHGSAPDISGQDKANPLAAILSGALMLDYLADKSGNHNLSAAAKIIEHAVENGFSENRLKPMEFGGDQGTRSLTSELIKIIQEKDFDM